MLLAPLTEVDPGIPPSRLGPPGHPPRIAVVGGARPEKGFDRLPAIARASRARTPAVFLVQLFNEQLSPEEWAGLCRFAAEPGVEAYPGELDRAGYLALFAAADLMLFPYTRVPYQQRPSGILSEAILSGLPVVVPAGTWLAEQVESGAAAGVVYEGEGPGEVAAISDAIARAVRDLPALRIQAREAAPVWRSRNTLEPFLDWFEREIAAREIEEPGRERLYSRVSALQRRLKASIRAWARG